jgi:lipid-A-disaccharide synthase
MWVIRYLDSVDAFRPDDQFLSNNNLTERSYISVLPGSRMQELKKIFPVMVSAMKLLPVKQFVIARTSLLSEELFIEILNKYHPAWKSHVQIITDKTYDLLQHTSSAMVTSGTATLETALFHVPQVVCYKTIPLNFRIAKSFVNVKYISLVNLIANKPIVKELIQGDLTPENLKAELALLEEDVKYRNKILEEYKELAKMIGEPGVAERMAEDMVERLKDFV